MTSDDLTADLPAPREDEPSTLRRDIADELADHLACAVRREQLKEGQGDQPRGSRADVESDDWWAQPTLRRGLERFGDPRAVARRLWCDHMRERIMAQRFTAIMAGVGAAACVAACLVLWQFVQDARAGQAASLAEMREFNAKLLAGLQRPAETPAADSGWAKVRVKLVDAESGEAINDAAVTLEGTALGSTNLLQLAKQ